VHSTSVMSRQTDLSQTPDFGQRLARSDGAGAAIEIEAWALQVDAFGRFVADIPAPLSIGTIRLADGRTMKGFLVEAEAVAGARDISSFGGWRAFLEKQKVSA
jgi:allophanate hydrolase